ncbi:MAG: pyridoxamine 5'-phosphate oxidase family protein, partial [Solirubrobacterales bacterium]|nr:pyridoxamine 5'-phosphate oxidase family protein [Solirubrobacterales bacterium]
MTLYYNKTPRTKVRRRSGRGRYDRATIHAILDEGLVGHVGIVSDDQPYVIPVLYARHGERIYLHGSPLSRLVRNLAAGVPMCLTVTLLDGLVLARSAFHHSMNYRSVVAL